MNREMNIKINVIGKITKLFVNRFELGILLILLVTVLGVTSYFLLPKESLPEIVFPTLNVQTIYPGATPGDVENLVTRPLEESFLAIDDVEGISSISNDGFSFITVEFKENVDIDRKLIELENAIAATTLPENIIEPKASTFNTSEFPLITLSLAGNYSTTQLTEFARVLKTELLSLDGVEKVDIVGAGQEEISVTLNSSLLEENQLSTNDVTAAISNANINLPLGEVFVEGSRFNLRIDEGLTSLLDIESIEVINPLGESFTVSELGTVTLENISNNQLNRSFTPDAGLQSSVSISVIRGNRKDVLSTSQQVKETANQAIGTLLPNDLDLIIARDTALQVEDDLNSIQSNALSGLLVVVLVLFLFIGFKESLIVSLTIPLTLLGTIGLLSFFNITLNTFAILGLIVALGLLVDNTIIVMENMDRLKKEGFSPKDAAVAGTNQVGFPIASATLTTVAAFFPLAILPGIIGAFINTIPRTIIITLITSLLFAVTITPAVYYFIYSRIKERTYSKRTKLILSITKVVFVGTLSMIAFYSSDVWIGIPVIGTVFFTTAIVVKEFLLKNKKRENLLIKEYSLLLGDTVKSGVRMFLVLLVAIMVLASSIYLITSERLKIAFFPETEPKNVVLNIDYPAGLSLETVSDNVSQVEGVLQSQNYIEKFITTIGGNEVDRATISVDLKESDVSGFDRVEELRNALNGYEDGLITFEATGAGGPPVGKPIELKIIGDDIEANGQLVDELKENLAGIDGVYNIESSLKEGSNEILYDLDINKAANYGLTPAYIGFYIRNILEGQVATNVNLNNESVDVRVKLDSASITNLEELTIMTPLGTNIKASDVITTSVSKGLTGITREEGNRVITLTADLEQGYNASEVTDIIKNSINVMNIPDGTTIDFDGESAGINESFGNLFRSLIIAVFLVFIILTLQFGSIKQPFIIIMTIPMALIGVLYGLTITGNEFGFYAFMALVSLVGIAVNDAIVLIDYMNYLRSEGLGFYEAIVEATKTRFNPVLATTLTTIGGILPLSYKNAYYAQFGYSLIFGLLITTIMTLVLIPVMYSIFEGRKVRKESKIKAGKLILD